MALVIWLDREAGIVIVFEEEPFEGSTDEVTCTFVWRPVDVWEDDSLSTVVEEAKYGVWLDTDTETERSRL